MSWETLMSELPLLELFGIGLLILGEGFFSGSEIALVSADRLKLQARAEAGERGARVALSLLEQPARLLGTCLIGTNVCTVSASTIVAVSLAHYLGDNGNLWSTLLLAFAILSFGEFIPKSVYHHHANRLAPLVALPLSGIMTLFTPALRVLDAAAHSTLRLLGEDPNSERVVSREEIQLLLEEGGEEELQIGEAMRDNIQRVFEFTEARAEQVMIPLIEMVMVEETSSTGEAIQRMVEAGFSRLPVYRDRVDRIVGYVSHEVLLFEEDLERPVRELLQSVYFVPENLALEPLMVELRRMKTHMSIVINEYGGAVGMVTREDVIEVLIGEIDDESDAPSLHLRRLGPRQWLASGRMELEDLEDAIGCKLPEGDYETLAGYLLFRLERLPGPGERVVQEDWIFQITEVDERVIRQIRIHHQPTPAGFAPVEGTT